MTNPVKNQQSLQGFNDGTESGQTQKANVGVGWTQDVDENFCVRVLVQETAGKSVNNYAPQSQYQHNNSGTWVNITATSSVVVASLSGSLTDGEDTTQRIGGGTHITTNAGVDEADGIAGGTAWDFAGNDEAEALYCFQIVGGLVADEDTVDFRVSDSNIDNYTASSIRATVNKAEVALVVSAITHGHTADNVLYQLELVSAEATHAHAADGATLFPDVTVADSLHGHAGENAVLFPDVTAAGALHSQTADNTTVELELVEADALHSHAAENATLYPDVTAADALHGHAADAGSFTKELVSADALHAHAGDNASFTLQSTLAIFDALHAHAADNATVTGISISAADGLHAHSSESPSFAQKSSAGQLALTDNATAAAALSDIATATIVIGDAGPALPT